MRHSLLFSKTFLRAFRRLSKKNQVAADSLRSTLELLTDDSFSAQLKTHKLKGSLDGFWSCSAGYDLRILFKFVDHEGQKAILLVAVGTHDEVY